MGCKTHPIPQFTGVLHSSLQVGSRNLRTQPFEHRFPQDFRGLIVRLETAKGGHKVFDLAGRGSFAGFKVAFNA
jgi:hypothetical protein